VDIEINGEEEEVEEAEEVEAEEEAKADDCTVDEHDVEGTSSK